MTLKQLQYTVVSESLNRTGGDNKKAHKLIQSDGYPSYKKFLDIIRKGKIKRNKSGKFVPH